MLESISPNPDPLRNLAYAAAYWGYKSPRCLSVVLARKTYRFLNDNVVYIGRRPHFQQSVLDAFIESRKGASLAGEANS